MSEEAKISRRKFIAGTVAAAIAGIVVGAGGTYAAFAGARAPEKTVTRTVTKTVTTTVTAPASPTTTPAEGIPSGPIKLGVITIFTGPGAMLFDPGFKALEIEVEKINAQGGILGRKIELVVKDSGGKPDVCVDHFKR